MSIEVRRSFGSQEEYDKQQEEKARKERQEARRAKREAEKKSEDLARANRRSGEY